MGYSVAMVSERINDRAIDWNAIALKCFSRSLQPFGLPEHYSKD